jgi:4-diphosphocytidyl-2-C-methyl-D-erythritol kinase
MAIEVFAPAKINLTLHVTGQRADGYHLLDSLVVFADVGDGIRMELAKDLSLEITGPKAAGLQGEADNLILRAARRMQVDQGARIVLDKVLPVSSGIGGGSSDAAAAMRGLASLWQVPLPDDPQALGADVPVCLRAMPTRMRGIGDVLDHVPTLPPSWLVLVNPGVAVSTPEVFKRLASKDNAPMPEDLPEMGSAGDFAAWLKWMRNDLERPAILIQPVIATVLAALRMRRGCLLARMSGSGATCWGMFDNPDDAARAAEDLARERPDWWVQSAEITPT